MVQDLRGEDWNIVSSIRFTGDVEILVSVFRKLFEEEGKEGVYIFAGCDGVTDRTTAVRKARIDGLIKKNDGGV